MYRGNWNWKYCMHFPVLPESPSVAPSFLEALGEQIENSNDLENTQMSTTAKSTEDSLADDGFENELLLTFQIAESFGEDKKPLSLAKNLERYKPSQYFWIQFDPQAATPNADKPNVDTDETQSKNKDATISYATLETIFKIGETQTDSYTLLSENPAVNAFILRSQLPSQAPHEILGLLKSETMVADYKAVLHKSTLEFSHLRVNQQFFLVSELKKTNETPVMYRKVSETAYQAVDPPAEIQKEAAKGGDESRVVPLDAKQHNDEMAGFIAKIFELAQGGRVKVYQGSFSDNMMIRSVRHHWNKHMKPLLDWLLSQKDVIEKADSIDTIAVKLREDLEKLDEGGDLDLSAHPFDLIRIKPDASEAVKSLQPISCAPKDQEDTSLRASHQYWFSPLAFAQEYFYSFKAPGGPAGRRVRTGMRRMSNVLQHPIRAGIKRIGKRKVQEA
eukprot:GHVT01082418.1.p1 GENE.GHVT01082418.1~~GHVT01082418.1.p1  ORF type:complete len:447 (+),score=54.98 GHVT01082418.1:1647-2987(+)